MDHPPITGHRRPAYADLCRSTGSDSSFCHNQYLASMPLSTGPGFPFLSGMFTGSLPPNSPFRNPATPGANNMRQFWPPTPPPDGGYGRYAVSTNFFPLFGSPSPEGTFLTQGLVSRLASNTHLSPLMDHKEHSFFSHGVGSSSHVSSSSPFPHLIPSLERHPVYSSHMTLGNKELEELSHDPDDKNRLMKNHYECMITQDIPFSRHEHIKSKNDNKTCDKLSDECCKLSPSYISHDSFKHHEDSKNCHQHTNKVQPRKIEVNHSLNFKHDLLPPIESLKLGVAPKKLSESPLVIESVSPVFTSLASYEDNVHTRCSQCCASIKDIGIATKLNVNDLPTPERNLSGSTTSDDTQKPKTNSGDKPTSSPVVTIASVEFKALDQSIWNTSESSPIKSASCVTPKHITAAVIPTAPKQIVHRDIHPDTNILTITSDYSDADKLSVLNEQTNYCTEKHVKTELTECFVKSQTSTNEVSSSNFQTKSPNRSCKVKDMIKDPFSAKQSVDAAKNTDVDTNQTSFNLSPSLKVIPDMSVSCQNEKVQLIHDTLKCNPLCTTYPATKPEIQLHCESKENTNWSKATVFPFSWKESNSEGDQAINLTVSKKVEFKDRTSATQGIHYRKSDSENTGVIGVCHPNPIAIGKIEPVPTLSSISNFSSISVVNQPVEQSAEVHILHRASKSSYPAVSGNGASSPLKSNMSHVAANVRAVKAERLLTKRGKISELDRISLSGRTTLATLAPKLANNMSKDGQSVSATSSSVSSTSIMFPATVNSCIPVGIAIAQQRQDSAATGKSQSSVTTGTSNALSSNSSVITSNCGLKDIQPQDLVRDQKNEDLSFSNHTTPVESNLLVTQGPTLFARQWESEALTRSTLPSPWVGSIVTPAVWLGQSAYAATATNPVPALEPSPISLPPGGYQLARDSLTGHLLLIPTANIGNLPVPQLVTQQQHSQFEQVLPQADTLKTAEVIDSSCNISSGKNDDKLEDNNRQVSTVPLASGQTYAFTTFPTHCDPSGFSYVLQSSTVMHLAHTQTSMQTESGKRSQATSPLLCATPSPVPCSVQDDESENDLECSQIQNLNVNASVTTAVQVDMDSQTNSEDECLLEKTMQVEMSDSANQTEMVPSESPKSELEIEDTVDVKFGKSKKGDDALHLVTEKEIANPLSSKCIVMSTAAPPELVISVSSLTSTKDNIDTSLEIVTSEQLAPSLPVESKPVMDFIDHHGLNLLVDSIEEFASREHKYEPEEKSAAIEKHSSMQDSPAYPDGLGLLCALAEQRIFEEALDDSVINREPKEDSNGSSVSSSPEATEVEMRLQIEELHKKYKQKQKELELLRNKREREEEEILSSVRKGFLCTEIQSKSSPVHESKSQKLSQSVCPIDTPKEGLETSSENINACENYLDDFTDRSSKAKELNCKQQKSEGPHYTKTPFFDEQAWFVRRSERIFLSDARAPVAPAGYKSNQKSRKHSIKDIKGKREKSKKPDNEDLKSRVNKNKSRKLSSDYLGHSSDESSEGENSDAASSTSENMPLSSFVDSSASKASSLDRQKRLSSDSEMSSGQSEDIPLSALLEHKALESCILKSEDLKENARLLVLDEGLFYAGYITESDDPNLYGILIDGDRSARPHMFSKEEILNAAVLEIKPTHKMQLVEGSRICAFWSQQYRCLYPGTIKKASCPLTDPSLLYVEFDDGDSGRIPLSDIRMLPQDFPIVSMEPNPFMILGKRRSRTHSQNNPCFNSNDSNVQRNSKDRSECKNYRNLDKSSKKAVEEIPNSWLTATEMDEGENDFLVKKPISKMSPKPKKHKRHKDDHYKHHHHHKHHHHKKHKQIHSVKGTVINFNKMDCDSSMQSSEQECNKFVLSNFKSDLTVKIKKSPPHTNSEESVSSSSKVLVEKKRTNGDLSNISNEGKNLTHSPVTKIKKLKLYDSQNKQKDPAPSCEKSKIAAFLPVRQLWSWSGKSHKRPGVKGKAKKEFYKAIQRGKELIRVGDCAVFLSTGRPHLPYIGRIETMWESWGGKMDVKVKWFYHPEETKSGKKLSQLKGALFQSPHFDENDVQTISHRCEVLSWKDYQKRSTSEKIEDNNDTYFLAGTYDPILGTLILEPGVPNIASSNCGSS